MFVDSLAVKRRFIEKGQKYREKTSQGPKTKFTAYVN